VLFDSLLVDTALEDRAAEDAKLPAPSPPRAKGQAVRQALPASLPRIEHHHEIPETHCACGQALRRIGEEVSEQLDCVTAQFFVLRHIRCKYACACCQSIAAVPMPAQMIDNGIPAPGLLAQVVVAKLNDHLPLYRQEEIYARSGVHIARSSMAQWIGICGHRLAPLAQALKQFILGHAVVHADETPVALTVGLKNCCLTAGSRALDEREVAPACRLNAERRRWLRCPMHTAKTTPCGQRRSLTSAPVPIQIVSTTFIMDAMLGRCLRQLKMPRPDAYVHLANPEAYQDLLPRERGLDFA
jgi:transposase